MNFLRNKNILLLGGSGFLGKSIIKKLLELGSRLVVITRNESKIKKLKLSGEPGQLEIISGNVFEEGLLENNIINKFAVINLCGILFENEINEFEKIHSFLPSYVSELCKRLNVSKFIHVSALGASKNSKSLYARSKALGEEKVLKKFENAIILRPSIIFGNNDNFFGQFAKISNFSPILPLIGSNTKFQPIYIEDISESVINLLKGDKNFHKIYEMGGPKIYTFEQLLLLMLKTLKKRRFLLKLNPKLMMIPGYFFNFLPKPPFTADQMKLLLTDNTVNSEMPGLKELNIKPTSLEEVIPKILKFYKS